MLKTLFKLILLSAVIAAAWWGFDLVLEGRALSRLENRAHAAYSEEDWYRAISLYDDLLHRLRTGKSFFHDPGRMRKVRGRLAECYVHLAENPELSLAESLEFYRRAVEYDPEAVDDQRIKRMLALPPEKLPWNRNRE